MAKVIANIRYSFNLWCQMWLAVSDSITDHESDAPLGGYLNN